MSTLGRISGRPSLRRLIALAIGVAPPIAAAAWPQARPLPLERLGAAGLRVVESEHATLVTDLPASAEVDRLPGLIDAALPQWAERFGLAAPRGWRLRLYLVADEAPFRALGLWPAQSPEFLHGLSLGYEAWVRDQPSDYYRRHLVLHEATHSFMSTTLGSCGPGWFMEGTAELCGAHDFGADGLRLGVMPRTRDDSPDWGRVRLVRDAAAPWPVAAVMRVDNARELPPDAYAWVWALCWFLDNHPAYRERFATLPRAVNDRGFDQRFRTLYAPDARRLAAEWRLFAATLVYGHDLAAEAIDFRDGAPLTPGDARTVSLDTGRGWQSSRVALRSGERVRITARGRFTIGREPDGTPWLCEAPGVTLRYHTGRPVGELAATLDAGPGALVESARIGASAVYTPPADGTLYLRAHDAPDSLADNAGRLEVTVTRPPE